MANFDFDLGLLEHQLHLARQNAIQTELAAAGLQEVGHPMLMCILHTAGARGADGQTQRELAQLLHVSPAAVATSLKSLEKKGYICRAFTGLSNEEQAVLRGFYLRMLDNLRGNSRPHSTPKEES